MPGPAKAVVVVTRVRAISSALFMVLSPLNFDAPSVGDECAESVQEPWNNPRLFVCIGIVFRPGLKTVTHTVDTADPVMVTGQPFAQFPECILL